MTAGPLLRARVFFCSVGVVLLGVGGLGVGSWMTTGSLVAAVLAAGEAVVGVLVFVGGGLAVVAALDRAVRRNLRRLRRGSSLSCRP